MPLHGREGPGGRWERLRRPRPWGLSGEGDSASAGMLCSLKRTIPSQSLRAEGTQPFPPPGPHPEGERGARAAQVALGRTARTRLRFLLYQIRVSFAGLGDAWGQPSRIGPLDNVAMELGSHLLQVVAPFLLPYALRIGNLALRCCLSSSFSSSSTSSLTCSSPPHHDRSLAEAFTSFPSLAGLREDKKRHQPLVFPLFHFFSPSILAEARGAHPLCARRGSPSPKSFNQPPHKCRGCPQEAPGDRREGARGENTRIGSPVDLSPENAAVHNPGDLLWNSSEFRV